jgi:rod shape-determining protein MreC
MRQETSSKTHVALACLGCFLLSLFLTAYSAKNPAVAQIGSTILIKAVAPVLEMVEVVRGGCVGAWNRYVNLINTANENSDLKLRISELENRVAVASEAQRENIRLRQILNFSADNQLQGVTAAVIGGDPSGWTKGVVISKGSNHGVKPGMAVLHPRGVVGQVTSVAASSSKVLLVSDHASGVDVLMQTSRARGVVEGAGEQVCELKFVTKDVQVRMGEEVITSGMDGVYPKGIVVGHVAQVGTAGVGLFQPIEVKPAVDFSRLEEVLVVPSAASDVGMPVLNYPPQGLKGGD